ncbi:MAG: hypothetical protein ACRD07_03340 [Acidimicrobiales bacterium]
MGRSLLEILRDVAVDPAEQAVLEELGAAPYLARHGFHEVDAEDVREAVDLVADTLPPEVAQALTLARSGLVRAAGQPGEMDIAAFGDVTEQLDGMPPRHTRDHDGAVASGGDVVDAPHRTADAPGGPETSLTFGAGAGAGAGPPGPDHVVGPQADTMPGAGQGLSEVGAVVAQGPLDLAPDLAPDLDTGAGVEAADALTGDIDDTGSYEIPDDPAVLDDIGSF